MSSITTKNNFNVSSRPISIKIDLIPTQLLFTLCRNLTHKNYMIITKHSSERMTERNISITDIENILVNPSELIESRYKDEHNDNTYWIKGNDSKKSVVVSIDLIMNILTVITVILL